MFSLWCGLLACVGAEDTTMADSRGPAGDDTGTTDLTSDTQDTATGQSPPPRGLWIWDNSIPGDPDKTSDLFSFAEERGVTTFFLTCDPVGYGLDGAVERYTEFVDLAHEEGLQV